MDSKLVEKEAKKIMDNFIAAMSDIDVEVDYDLERESFFREEGEGSELDEDFRQRFLANSKKTIGDAVVANKGDWEK